MKLYYFLLLFFLSCTAKTESNLHVDQFQGTNLSGETKFLKDINSPRVVLNVYSPTCVPCFKEIPTLNYLYREMKSKSMGEFYMVVDPTLLVEDAKLSQEELEKKAISIMQMEVQKRNIELPILVMREPFRVDPQKGLVTGTPETLLFKTSPLRLYYNFLGSISEKTDPIEIEKDSRVKFFMRTLGGI